MDFNVITERPLRPGYGLIIQGNCVDDQVISLPLPLFIVHMNEEDCDHKRIDHMRGIVGVLSIQIGDCPSAVLSDSEYIAAVFSVVSYLKQGINVYIHCAAGWSRSSYLTIGVLMNILCISFDDALSYLRVRRPGSNPNPGFVAHLKRLSI